MKQTLKNSLRAMLIVPLLALGVATVLPASTYAAAPNCDPSDVTVNSGANCAQGDQTPTNLFGAGGIFQTITNVLLFIIGAVSVIMLIIGGIRYTVSGGDSAAVTSAKNTILYAVVGIIVALLAYAIVNFVLGSLTQP